MNETTRAWLDKVHAEARSRVTVACDEYHVHHADCLHGAADAVNICRLVDIIRMQSAVVDDFTKKFSRV